MLHFIDPYSPTKRKRKPLFNEGREILDGVFLLNEYVDYAKRSRKGCLLVKVDFEKVYDSVSWMFLEYMMGKMDLDLVG
jgi:hypothetical protein